MAGVAALALAAIAVVAVAVLVDDDGRAGVRMRSIDYGDQWPLTAAGGWLECSGAGNVLFTVDDPASPVDGKTFVLNPRDPYTTFVAGWMDVAVIRAAPANPTYPGEHVYLGGLIARGQELCD